MVSSLGAIDLLWVVLVGVVLRANIARADILPLTTRHVIGLSAIEWSCAIDVPELLPQDIVFGACVVRIALVVGSARCKNVTTRVLVPRIALGFSTVDGLRKWLVDVACHLANMFHWTRV